MTALIRFVKAVIFGAEREFKGFEARTDWRSF
jgi:hypothetical protein